MNVSEILKYENFLFDNEFDDVVHTNTSIFFNDDQMFFENDETSLNEILKLALIDSFKKSFSHTKVIWLTIFLSILATIGSISNFTVVVLFHLRDDCMESINQKNVNNNGITSTQNDWIKNRRINSKNKKPIYLLIQYLALIDFFTCSIALPGTIVEIWRFGNPIPELFCRGFELLRATGIILSNFLVVFITFERYILICNPFCFSNLKNTIFKKILIVITILSLLIGIISMLQISVYQIIDDKIVYVGICLPSNITLSADRNSILKFLITGLLCLGALIVGFFYIQIFRSAFNVNKKRAERIELANRFNETVKNYNSIAQDQITTTTHDESLSRNSIKLSIKKRKRSLKFNNKEDELIEIEENSENDAVKKTTSSVDNDDSKNSYSNNHDIKIIERLNNHHENPINNRSFLSPVPVNTLKSYRKSLALIRTNVRMATMIFFVTKVYYFSIIPWILTINNIIKFNPFVYYTFTLNCSLNPLIYFFFNSNFRKNVILFIRSLVILIMKGCKIL